MTINHSFFPAMRVSENSFGVPPVITARDMADPEVDHIGTMAYAAWHRLASPQPFVPEPPRAPTPEPIVVAPPPPPSPTPPPSPAFVPSDCYATTGTTLPISTTGYIDVSCLKSLSTSEKHTI